MNTHGLIVIAIVVIFALAGVMGGVYLNNAHLLSNGNITIAESPGPLGSVEETCMLAVSSQGEGTVVIDPYKTSYEQGETVTLRAVCMTGHSFVGWEGAVSSTNEEITVTITGQKMEVEAVFK